MNEYLVKSAIILLLVVVCHAEGEPQAHRRGVQNMGLFPFPRVGRADPLLYNPYADMHEEKRQGLIPFPRVGRNELRSHFGVNEMNLPAWILPDNMVEFQKRNGGSNVNGGMWFGPRLGRLQKRSFGDYNDGPWAVVALKDPSLRQTEYAQRLTRDSEEDNDDAVVEEVLSSRRMDGKTRNNISQQ